MSKDVKWKLLLIAAIGIVFLGLTYPPKERIKLGLDLKGGIHLRMEVETEDAVRAETDILLDWTKQSLEKEELPFNSVVRTSIESFEISGITEDSMDEFKDFLKENLKGWDYQCSGTSCSVDMEFDTRKNIEEGAVNQALDTISRRINEYGVAEPTIQREGMGGNRILVQLPGVEDPGRVKELIKDTAFLEYKLLYEGISPAPTREGVLKQFENGELPEDAEVLKGEEEGLYYPLHKSSVVTGRDLINASTTTDRYNMPAVSFTLDNNGTEKIEKVSSEHIGERMAVVLDGIVIVAPEIQGKLSSNSIIQGRFTFEEAQDLALKLRAGALPAGIKYLEERTVGPSLGIDSIRQGVMAAALGFALVMVFMILFYRLSGINAVIALLMNLIIIVGTMAALGATLTLPGIAGYILTIGMAVDANVLIFERIKEELRAGKTPRSAVEGGFKKALSAIVDSNITTLIAAMFLFQFGTGPIKGFAITLSIGILASMFTAIFVSRTIYSVVLGRPGRRVERVSI